MNPKRDPDSPGDFRLSRRARLWCFRVIVLGCVWSLLVTIGGYAGWSSFFATLVGWVIIESGLGAIRQFAKHPPEPVAEGDLRKVKNTYRCDICGTEVTMTLSSSDDPEPPRHCLEDMELVESRDVMPGQRPLRAREP